MFINFFFSKIVLRKNVVQLDKSQMRVWRIRIVFWIPKTTNTHTQVV